VANPQVTPPIVANQTLQRRQALNGQPSLSIFFDRSLLGGIMGAGADFTKEGPPGYDR